MTIDPGTGDSGAGPNREAAGAPDPTPSIRRLRWRPVRNRIRALLRRYYILSTAAAVVAGVAALHLGHDLILALWLRSKS